MVTQTNLNYDGCARLAQTLALTAVKDIARGVDVYLNWRFLKSTLGQMAFYSAGIEPEVAWQAVYQKYLDKSPKR
jgi:hypothetical protein